MVGGNTNYRLEQELLFKRDRNKHMKLDKKQFYFLSCNISPDLISRLKHTTDGENVQLVVDKILFCQIIDKLTMKLMTDGLDEESNINSFGSEIERIIDKLSPIVYD
jgi:hypothetical protein